MTTPSAAVAYVQGYIKKHLSEMAREQLHVKQLTGQPIPHLDHARKALKEAGLTNQIALVEAQLTNELLEAAASAAPAAELSTSECAASWNSEHPQSWDSLTVEQQLQWAIKLARQPRQLFGLSC